MEVHVRTVSDATFDLPTPETVVTSAKYTFNGGSSVNLIPSSEAGVARATLPYFREEGNLSVTWGFVIPGSGSYTDTINYKVVRPYLTIAEVKAIWPEASTADAIAVERAVRHVINAHTGQSFGYATKTLTVEGHGESALRLPERLVEIQTLSTLRATLNIHRSIITSDGWYLKKGWTDEVSVIESDDEYFGDYYVHNDVDEGEPGYVKPGHGHIINAPGSWGRATKWRDDYPFKITGKWGYVDVPEPVREAARLLVNDYACSEALYRDRYLESIKAADWRMQFSSRAWEYTGNVRADQLLSEFVLLDWAVV